MSKNSLSSSFGYHPPQNMDILNSENHSLGEFKTLITFETSKFHISGQNISEMHSLNKSAIFLIFLVFHFDISGNAFNEVHE